MFDRGMAAREGGGVAGYQVGRGTQGTAPVIKDRGEWGRDG